MTNLFVEITLETLWAPIVVTVLYIAKHVGRMRILITPQTTPDARCRIIIDISQSKLISFFEQSQH